MSEEILAPQKLSQRLSWEGHARSHVSGTRGAVCRKVWKSQTSSAFQACC